MVTNVSFGGNNAGGAQTPISGPHSNAIMAGQLSGGPRTGLTTQPCPAGLAAGRGCPTGTIPAPPPPPVGRGFGSAGGTSTRGPAVGPATTASALTSGSGNVLDQGTTSIQGSHLPPIEQNCLWMTSSGLPGKNMRLASVNVGEATHLTQRMGDQDPSKTAYISAAAHGRTNPTLDSTRGHAIHNIVDNP